MQLSTTLLSYEDMLSNCTPTVALVIVYVIIARGGSRGGGGGQGEPMPSPFRTEPARNAEISRPRA